GCNTCARFSFSVGCYVCTDSYCGDTSTYGIGPCSADAFLRAQYVEAGFHAAGDFGTSGDAPSPYKAAGKKLGFMADYGKDGWNKGTPPYAGDYFLPGDPLEGVLCKVHAQVHRVHRTPQWVMCL